jgi:hypothetical protein
LQFAPAKAQPKIAKEYVFSQRRMEESQCTTMYKNNSGLIAKTKVDNNKKGLCLTEKLVCNNPLLFLYETVSGKFC